MATSPDQKPFSGQAYLDSILWGGWHWSDDAHPSGPTEIKYLVYDAGTAWTALQIAALDQALQTWSAVANIVFTRVYDISEAQLVENLVAGGPLAGSLGEHGTPEDAATANPPGSYDGSLLLGGNGQAWGHFNVNEWSDDGLVQGGYDFVTLVHELGHGLGLAHPHDNGGGSLLFPGVTGANSLGSYKLNQGIYTVMSYNDGWESGQNPLGHGLVGYGYEAGPMAFDIAAIQYLYGANTTTNCGDNVYVLPDVNAAGTFWSCIWDTGGEDKIVYNGTANVIIDLNDATLNNSPTGGGIPSYAPGIYGGFTIANGVVIEDAAGGSGNDTLTGNEADNELDGNDGSDLLIGGAGGDELDGGNGTDTASYATSSAGVIVDLVLASGSGGDAQGDTFATDGGVATVENLIGSASADYLRGSQVANRIDAGAGDDTVEGDEGDDVLIGGTNTSVGDTVSYAHASTGVHVSLLLTTAQNTIGAGVDTLTGFENIQGSDFDDWLVGNNFANWLQGGAGMDTLNGGKGHDTLLGGADADMFVFDAKLKAANSDTVVSFEVGLDLIELDNAIFKKLTLDGALSSDNFAIGAAADLNDYIIYDSSTGGLYYDKNGLKSGGAVQFAQLDAGLSLSASDFLVI